MRYQFDEGAKDALAEFFQMAYFHGVLQDLPDLKFLHPDGDPSESSN